MKTLLFITPCLSFAGAEKILCWLAEKFSEKKYNVHILNLQLLNNGSDFEIRNLKNIKVHILSPINVRGMNNIYRIAKIVNLAKEIHADLLISFTRYPCILSSLSGKLAHIPVIISERGDPYKYTRGLRNKIGFLIMNTSDGCVFQTKNAMKCYGTALQKRSVIIPNPVFESKIHCQSPDRIETDIVSVGRIEIIQKRYDLMIKGFAEFIKIYPKYRLIIYGKGPDEDKLRKLIDKYKIEENVMLKGLTTDSLETMSKCGIFIITSDFEGIPNALLEAMSIGMPVISTDCSPGGARFLITDHENGLLIPTGDYHSIAEALVEFASNNQLKKQCGANAKRVKDLFAPNALFNEWEKYILMISK